MANGELKYTEGPSAEEWETHRETITQLYYKMSLKDLSDYMKKRHSFYASKRMYDSRFRRWQVFKTMKKAEREKLKLSQSASPRSESNFTDVKTARKVSKSRIVQPKRRPLDRLAPKLNVDIKPQPEQCLPSPTTVKSEGYGTPETQSTLYYARSCSPDAPSTAKLPPSPDDSTCVNTPSTIAASAPMDIPEHAKELTLPPISSIHRSPPYDYLERPRPPNPPPPSTPSISPSRSISPPTSMQRVELMLSNIEAYYDWQIEQLPAERIAGMIPPEALDIDKMFTSPASKQFWTNINTGIYLLKFSSSGTNSTAARPDRAFSAFQEGCTNAALALTTVSFDFPLQLLARLSPTNTKICLSLRSNLLCYLAGMSLTKLGPRHPITLICQALQQDEHSESVSQKGIEHIWHLFRTRLAGCQGLEFEIAHLQTKLRRRSGDIIGAVVQANELLERAGRTFGAGAKQTRMAASELAHAYMATKQYDLAMKLCQGVVRGATLMEQPEKLLEDGIAAHAMEDIAELHQKNGDLESSIAWLEKAATNALRLWGSNMATVHIVDKLSELLHQCGRIEEAKKWEGLLDVKDIGTGA